MEKILIAIGFGLVLLILYQIFRFFTLYSLIKGEKKAMDEDINNRINAIMMIIFLVGGMFLVFWYSNKASKYYLPEPATIHGVLVDDMFWMTLYITGIVFVATHILLFYFPYRYRHKPGRKAYWYPFNNKLEIVWTVIPTITFVVMFILGLNAWNKITSKAPDDAIVIEVVGQQFSWLVRYTGPDGTLGEYDYRLIDAVNGFGMDLTDRASFDDFSTPQIHVPKGKPILFKIRAKDVIHSVYIPHFRLKMDAVPGMPTRFHFQAKYTTAEMQEKLDNPDFEYEMACAEVCGRGHFAMRMVVVVEEEQDYNKWLQEQDSWLSKHPEYLSAVPDELKSLAKAKMEKSDSISSTPSLSYNF